MVQSIQVGSKKSMRSPELQIIMFMGTENRKNKTFVLAEIKKKKEKKKWDCRILNLKSN